MQVVVLRALRHVGSRPRRDAVHVRGVQLDARLDPGPAAECDTSWPCATLPRARCAPVQVPDHVDDAMSMRVAIIVSLGAIGGVCAASIVFLLRAYRVSMLDAADLVSKIDVPRPLSACDWPELHVDAVVADPDLPRVLVLVRWPAHPRPRSLLVLEPAAREPAEYLLQSWRDSDASVSPMRDGDAGLILRRRRSSEQLCALLLDEIRAG
jgi:hypothetical protein